MKRTLATVAAFSLAGMLVPRPASACVHSGG